MTELKIVGLVKRYGALLVTDNVTLDVLPGEIHAVIGPNGAGKTSLINQLSGEVAPDSGTVMLGNVDITSWPAHMRARSGLMRTYQITSIFEDFTVLENTALSTLGRQGQPLAYWRAMLSRADLRDTAEAALEATGLIARANIRAGELGYGERRQLEMAMGLAADPKVLLLDEPMAGMSAQESLSVVELLKKIKSRYGMLLVEHDMDAVFALADRISVLVYGKVILTGTPEEIRNHPEVQAVYLGTDPTK